MTDITSPPSIPDHGAAAPVPRATRLSWQQAADLVAQALQAAGALPEHARPTAEALVRAEAQGLASHGLGRVPSYTAHLRSGRAVGDAQPVVAQQRGATLLIDARDGLAFAACAMGIEQAMTIAREQGIALLGVTNSHHAGVLVDHLRPAAAAGMVGLAVTNASACMPAAGGKRALFGTNPIAAIFPRQAGHQPADPIMIDLALSEVARGKLMTAAQRGQSIPLGWALDAEGQPTTDPVAGLEGTLLPIGASTSPKGAMLALMVEVLASALLGAHFSHEMGSFFTPDGAPLRMGHLFILIDPGAMAGQDAYYARLEELVNTMLEDDGVRLAGARRLALERDARANGIDVPPKLLAQITELAARPR